MAAITVHRIVEWDTEVFLRDEPYGDNGVFLKPLQLDVLLTKEFPEGTAITLPQPDASYSCCSVVRHAASWHFLQPAGCELIIAAAAWPAVRMAILEIYHPRDAQTR